MIVQNLIMPEKYSWKEEKGLVYTNSKREEVYVANAIPYVLKRKKVINHKDVSEVYKVEIGYCEMDGKILSDTEEFTDEEILSGKFVNRRPINVIIGVGFERKIIAVYRFLVQQQLKNVTVEKEEIYEFGWNGRKFYWGKNADNEYEKAQIYKAALIIAFIISKDNYAVPAVVLAAVHGPIKYLLKQAGIHHDFVTFIVGNTAVGKTSLADSFCSYLPDRNVRYAFNSNRKDLMRIIQDINDITILLDDYCKSSSIRTQAKLEQTVSEIIQNACDAGQTIVDKESSNKKYGEPHLILTGEKVVYNESSLNRCFLVKMDKSIEGNLWRYIRETKEKGIMKIFMQNFIGFIERHFEELTNKCRSDYEVYLLNAEEKNKFSRSSINRLSETIAVQSIINKRIVEYFRDIGIDGKICEKVKNNFDQCISRSTVELRQEIDNVLDIVRQLRLLPALAEIILDACEGDVAETEEKYLKRLQKGKKCLGINVHPGYISFKKAHMIKLIAEYLKEDIISEKEFDKEIRSFPVLLTHSDAEGKNSNKWGTTCRLFHICVRNLIEWTRETRVLSDRQIEQYCIDMFERKEGDIYSWIDAKDCCCSSTCDD